MNALPLPLIRLVSPTSADVAAAFIGIGCVQDLSQDARPIGVLAVVVGAVHFGGPIACVIETLRALEVRPNGVPYYEIAERVGEFIARQNPNRAAVWAEILRLCLALYADGANCADVVRHVVRQAAMAYHGVTL